MSVLTLSKGTLVHRAGSRILEAGSVWKGKGSHIVQSLAHVLGNFFAALVFSPTFTEVCGIGLLDHSIEHKLFSFSLVSANENNIV